MAQETKGDTSKSQAQGGENAAQTKKEQRRNTWTNEEIVVVITCRIGKDAVEHRLVHLALNLVEISTLVEFLLLGISAIPSR